MDEIVSRFASLPAHALGGIAIILLYVIQSEVRFGSRARSHRAGSTDRMSSVVVSAGAAVSILGFALAIKARSPGISRLLPPGFGEAMLPGTPAIAWTGVAIGACGLALRLWAVLVLRERYTRTLLVHEGHTVERNGPYRWVRHPGYLGSLLALNGVALASANWIVVVLSLAATATAYAYRVKVEDEMLVAALGEPYAQYRREVPALLPRIS